MNADLPKNMLAAGVVASGCVGLLNPLDTARIRFQVSTAKASGAPRSLLSFCKRIVAREGLRRGLWLPGMTSNMAAISISSGFRLGVYPIMRDSIDNMLGNEVKSPLVMWISGLVPGLFSYWFITPLYQVKTRIQIAAHKGETQNALLKEMALLWKEGGLNRLYLGSMSLMARGGLISSGQTLGYDLAKTKFKERGFEETPLLHFTASMIAGVSATIFGMPADRLFTYVVSSGSRGVIKSTRAMVREQGIGTFYRGSSAFFLRVVPIFVLYFPLYEQARKLLGLGFMD